MADFIPGEAYRLDIVGADESTLVDSWQGVIKADVVSNEGLIQVDVSTGKLYGPLVGDIHDPEGNVVYNSSERLFKADVSGSVYDNSGATKLIDGINARINAPVYGNIVDPEGTTIVDATNRTVTATTITGDLYGDVYGNITSEGVVYGTFSGDFNGTSYGEFFGNTVGEHTGDVIGDVTGNLTGVVFGRLDGTVTVTWTEEEGPVPLHGWNPQFNQHEFLGGIGSPHMPAEGDTARGPVLIVGENRGETSLRANVIHYNGQEIITLHDPVDPTCDTAPATIRGHFDGVFVYTDGETAQDALTADLNGTTVHAVNGKVTIGGYINDYSECDLNILADCITTETNADEDIMIFKKHRGTLTAKTTVATNDPMVLIHAQGYNGNTYVDAGRFGFVAKNVPSNGNHIESEFNISLPNSAESSLLTNSKKLTFNNNGVLTVPVFKAKGTTFADRDSMVAQAGMIIFNVNTNKFQGYDGTNWIDLH